MQHEPMILLDYPDPDVIRVEDTYYLVSTTMHFMPGCEILRSKDLVNWEHATYVYDKLDSTLGQTLTGDQQIYGKGMWAATIRYHRGTFYICFVANDTNKTYLYTAKDINGPWEKHNIEGFYHDCSLLFDDDGRIFIVYGNREIHLTELKEDLSGPKPGGLDRIIISEENQILGYEGSHLYKINGKYYLFFIHSLPDRWRRTEVCFMADSIDGEFTGWEVFNDDIGYCDQGVAQGGIVDTPDGRWYAILFQDRGGVGRLPVLLPVTWEGDKPIFGDHGRMPADFMLAGDPDADVAPLVGSDDFRFRSENCFGLKPWWQFNHEPEEGYCIQDTDKGIWSVTNNKICSQVTQTRNMITMRMTYPCCTSQITLDAEDLKDGDVAGLCILQYSYGCIGLKKEDGRYYLIVLEYLDEERADGVDDRDKEGGKEVVHYCREVDKSLITLRISADFTEMKDIARFAYLDQGKWTDLGIEKKLNFSLKHFCGCRAGLFNYATKQTGGTARFSSFIYNDQEF